MNYQKLAKLLFPNILKTPQEIESIYPERNLPDGAPVTRIGPSPTGFIHLGNLYNAIIAERLAHQNNGVFYLRIEDTDNKREVPGAVNIIISSLNYYGITFDEGAAVEGDNGYYSPYRQRQRKDIYHVFAKQLVEMELAYPCFCSDDKLEAARTVQKNQKIGVGYYGEFATCRSLSYEEIESRIISGQSYVLRFRAALQKDETIAVKDAIRGELTMPPNQMDYVLLKSDGIPTYHFAHVVDDHLMKTTHVIRGEEWIPSLPIHVQLFTTFHWKQPIYCHTATLMKMDGNSKRKLSKRKDMELALNYYRQEGYLPVSLWHYMLSILNSNYEEWHTNNRGKSYLEFKFTLENMSNSGALFDLNKLRDISKDVIADMSSNDIYEEWLNWAKVWKPSFAAILSDNKELAIRVLSIGKNNTNKRKDLITWNQACNYMSMYFDETFEIIDSFPDNIRVNDAKEFLDLYLREYDIYDDKQIWFNKVKKAASQVGYAANVKDFKKNPENYKGSIIDLTNVLRIALTGRINAPDIWEVSTAIGKERTVDRIVKYIKTMKTLI